MSENEPRWLGQDDPRWVGPDLTQGLALAKIPWSGIVGTVGDEQVLLVRTPTDDVLAVTARCTHYQGPLGEGIVVDETVRCPCHHACFDLRTGEAIAAPAFDALVCWEVEQRGEMLFVQRKRTPAKQPRLQQVGKSPDRIVIVGGGAAGFAAAEMLRREGYSGELVLLSNDSAAPVDRPNLSKDYLAGKVSEDWVPLRPEGFYAENRIDLRLNANVVGIDVPGRAALLSGGAHVSYDRLLLATGGEPVPLSVPGAELGHVYTLRSLADCKAIIERAGAARRAVVLGASFIGLEVAAALRARGIEIHVVALDKRPMERIFGPQIGDFIRSLHEQQGVIFHLQEMVGAIEGSQVILKSGVTVDADFVVAGIGVRPRTRVAESAGLTIDRGVIVNAYLETNAPDVYAAGDIARWPDPHSGENIRVEHWVVAERQGQTAARNMLGYREQFTALPFFWTQQYDVSINYVGHAEEWDEIEIDGNIPDRDCALEYKRNGRRVALASIGRDTTNLWAEFSMELDQLAAGSTRKPGFVGDRVG
jgi:NADPH-dependent 2,4-dienoyl-CoA reductase/sulfur reductase-like enzyme/nitrite reductase/ring-hydroxylating ferredoxin subunit